MIQHFEITRTKVSQLFSELAIQRESGTGLTLTAECVALARFLPKPSCPSLRHSVRTHLSGAGHPINDLFVN